jgi:hypothetical protein
MVQIKLELKFGNRIYSIANYHPFVAEEYGRLIIGPGATKSYAEREQKDFKERGFRARIVQGDNGKYYVYQGGMPERSPSAAARLSEKLRKKRAYEWGTKK